MEELKSDSFIELLSANKLPQKYFDLVPYRAPDVGFSIKALYPTNCSFKPAVTKSGKPDTVALLGVAVYPEARADQQGRYPLGVRTSAHSIWLQNHIAYRDKGEDSPTPESREVQRSSLQPSDLFDSDHWIDLASGKIVNNKGEEISLIGLLDRQFSLHLGAAYALRGLPLRVVRTFYHLRIAFWIYFEKAIHGLLWLLTGQKLEDSEGFFAPIPKENLRTTVPSYTYQSLSVTPNVIFSYVVAVLIAAAVIQPKGLTFGDFLNKRSGNITLLAVPAVVFISLCLPWFLRRFVNLTRKTIRDVLMTRYEIRKIGPFYI